MKYLLDTHIWLWSLLTPEKLRASVVQVLEDEENEWFISPITVWETLVLAAKGRVELLPSPDEWIVAALERSPVKEAPLSHAIALKSRAISGISCY